ncbi:MAG: hypothetical protein ACFB14_11855 [Leptolyngbyaceae cyanobacterium]
MGTFWRTGAREIVQKLSTLAHFRLPGRRLKPEPIYLDLYVDALQTAKTFGALLILAMILAVRVCELATALDRFVPSAIASLHK